MQKFLWFILVGCLMIFQSDISYGAEKINPQNHFVQTNNIEKRASKKATLVVWNGGDNNRIFKFKIHFRYLREQLLQRGYWLNTYPTQPIEGSDLVIVVWRGFPDIPPKMKEKSFLWIMETPSSVKYLYQDNYLNQFEKVFTYQKKYVDNKHIFNLAIPYYFSQKVFNAEKAMAQKNVLIAQIAGNHYYDNRFLYHERRKDTVWLLENTHDQYKLYGNGWNKLEKELSDKGKKEFKSVYQGYIPNKQDAVKPAKFVLAYENASSDDYVTEKIFDVMVGGSVPVYLGAPNITEYVPADCFIDRTKFKSMAELYAYLSSMPDDVYKGYLERIRLFLQKADTHPKNAMRLMDQLIEHIFSDNAMGA